MRSPLTFWGSIVLLGTLPIALLSQAVFGVDAEMVVHAGLGLGCALLAAKNFKATPGWLMFMGSCAAVILEVIFLLQFLAQLDSVASLHRVAFDILGQWPESLFISLLTIWLGGVLLTDSRGATRILGWITVPPAILFMALSYAGPFLGIPLTDTYPVLKVLLLVPFIWLGLESRKPADTTAVVEE